MDQMSTEQLEKASAATADAREESSTSFLMSIINEIIYSPVNVVLTLIIGVLIYKIVRTRFNGADSASKAVVEQELPRMKRDFTVKELREYDGSQPCGRVLIGINGSVYDATKGKRFYGPGGPYASFAGRDASRNLATFSVTPNEKDEYDDLSDLTATEMDSVREWEMQFKEKYYYVGKLLREGEQPTNYDDEEEEEVKDESGVTAADSKPPAAASSSNASNDALKK